MAKSWTGLRKKETEDDGEDDDEDENDNESYGDYDGAGTKKFGARPCGKTETLAEVTPDDRKLKHQIGELAKVEQRS